MLALLRRRQLRRQQEARDFEVTMIASKADMLGSFLREYSPLKGACSTRREMRTKHSSSNPEASSLSPTENPEGSGQRTRCHSELITSMMSAIENVQKRLEQLLEPLPNCSALIASTTTAVETGKLFIGNFRIPRPCTNEVPRSWRMTEDSYLLVLFEPVIPELQRLAVLRNGAAPFLWDAC